MKLSLLDVLRIDPNTRDVSLTVIIDDLEAERAYEVRFVFDPIDDEALNVELLSTWTCLEAPRPVEPNADLSWEMARYVDAELTCSPLADKAKRAYRELIADWAAC